jgi:septal ring factor EnvC (AmiA/AmiB activator)
VTRALRARTLRAAALAAAVVAVPPAPAAGQLPQIESRIRESRQRLDAIRNERRELQKAMETLEARVHTLAAELENLNRQIDATLEVLRELEIQVAATEEAVRALTGELLQTQDWLVFRTAVLERRLREIYKRGPLADVQVLLAAESFGELLTRYKYLHLIALHDRLLIREVTELEARLRDRQTKLRRHLDELQRLHAEKLSELASLQALQRERERRLAGTQRERRMTQARLAQLEKDEAELASLVERLERERRAAESRATATPRAGTLATRSLGSLDWPVEGTILYPFGRQEVAGGVVIRRNGIGIQAPAGTPVRAVEAGTVVFAEPYFGYGPSVIVHHGEGYYSLYLYLDAIRVRAGQTVEKGEVVGTVGGRETPEGDHLEFQIREPGGRAVDPLRWLRSRRE